MKNYKRFLEEHKLRAEDIDTRYIVETFTKEMIKGLEGSNSSLRMIPTYIEADNQFLTDVPVVAIDAGGTNFRAAIVTFNSEGRLEMTKEVNGKMPGLKGEISKDEFFDTIANYIRPLAHEADKLGFCFSYPTETLPDKDGRLIQFSKEVRAPAVVGQLIGRNLLEALEMPEKQIVILNDTVATLLAGKSASVGNYYDSFIGFILGTGTNTCYIENNNNILKNKSLDPAKNQIINIESGNFAKAPQTDIDIIFDETTTNPGIQKFEKMISGGYFGNLCLITLKTAAKEGVFTGTAATDILSLNKLSSEDVNLFITPSHSKKGPLSSIFTENTDIDSCIQIVNCLLNRAAILVAANLAAVVIRTNKGITPEHPVLVTVEGSLYYKLYNFRSQIDKYFQEYLTGDRKRYVEFKEVKQSSLVGAALAALIN